MAKQHKDMAGRPVEGPEKPTAGHTAMNDLLRGHASPHMNADEVGLLKKPEPSKPRPRKLTKEEWERRGR